MLNVPPPTRIALGTLQVGGQKLELFLSPEWARYFQSLNAQVQATGPTLAQSAAQIALLGDAMEAPDVFPGPPGQQGMQGAPGLALFMLQDDLCEQAMLVPPTVDFSAPPAIGGAAPAAGKFTSLAASAGFGCNGKAAQSAAASGGTLAGVIAALVANGILSS
jgi:hypothetical protein